MKKKIGKIFILISGATFGLAIGYFLVFGLKHTSNIAIGYIKNVKKEVVWENPNKGGPSSTNFIFNNNKETSDEQKNFKISENAPKPIVDAKSYLVGDLDSGKIIFTENQNKALPIASISKLVTALVTDEYLGLSTEIKISEKAVSTYGRQGRLEKGEIYKASELLYALLLESSNDASEAIAESGVRDIFINEMNKKVREIEMYNTHFADPSGLSSRNVSTVNDLFKLAKYIDKYRKYVFEMTTVKKYFSKNKTWHNFSEFRSDPDYYGGKNGYIDEAGNTQLAIFNMNFNGENRRIVFIILNTKNIEENIYGLKRYVSKYITYE